MEKIVIDLFRVQDLSAKAFHKIQMMISLTAKFTGCYKESFKNHLFIFFLFVFGIEVALYKRS